MIWQVIVLTGVLWGAGPQQGEQPKATTKAEVVLIGLDGISLNLLLPMIEKGVTPVMGNLVKGGVSGPLESLWPLRTPQVWTSMVTGKYPGQHGIWDHSRHTYFNPPGYRTKKKVALTSKDRQSKALWKILDDKEIKTLTVGWIASWPVEELEFGQMASPQKLVGDRRQTSIKPSFYKGTQNTVWPRELHTEVESLYVEPVSITPTDLKDLGFAKLPPKGSPLYKIDRLKRYTYALSWSLARAQSVEKITRKLQAKRPAEVVLSYFQCSDTLLHRFWIFHESEPAIRERFREHGISTEHVRELKQRFGTVVEACYRDLDQRIGRILEDVAGPETLIILASDHGFGPADVPHRMPDEPFSGKHLDDGFLVVSGFGVNRGIEITGASVLDITPTILHFLGQPVGKDMKGRVLSELFQPAFRSPPNFISTYESKPQLKIPYKEGWPPKKVKSRVEIEALEKKKEATERNPKI